MSKKTSLQTGIELVTKATEEDRDGNYEEALALYNRSIQYFVHAIKFEDPGEQQKTEMRTKCSSYLLRAEEIKKFLREKEKAAAAEESAVQQVAALQLSESPDPSEAAGEDAAEEVAVAAAAAADPTEAVENDLMTIIKAKLLSLVSTAHKEQWTSYLRSAMQPLLSPQSQKLQSFNKIAAAEIAVQLAELEKKMPEELQLQLQKLTGEELRELLKTDWLEHAAKEEMEASDRESAESIRVAVNAVMLVVELSVEVPRATSIFESILRRKKRKTPEVKEETDCWIANQADLIQRWDYHHRSLASEQPVYLSPLEYLEKARAKVEATSDAFEVIEEEDVSLPLDRVERMKEHLKQGPPCTIDEFLKTRNPGDISRQSIKLGMMHAEERRERKNADIPYLIRRTVEDLPEELQRQLQGLKPKKLARVVLLDWVDRVVEEKRRSLDDKEGCSSAGILRSLLSLCSAASMYPENLRRVVKANLKKGKEERDKIEVERKQAMNTEDLKKQQELESGMSKFYLMTGLDKYMPLRKSQALLRCMLPPPQPFVPHDPTPDLPKWAILIKSIGMSDEIAKYTSQQLQLLQKSQLRGEIAAMLHAKFRDHTEKALKELEDSIRSMISISLDGKETRVDPVSQFAFATAHEWLHRVEEEKESKNEQGDHQESQSKECAPVTLAALIFMWATESSRSAEFLGHRLTELKIRKSAELIDSEEARAFTKLRTANMEDSTNSKAYLFAWIDEKSSEILRKGHELMTLVLEQHMQPSPEIVQPSTEPMQPVQTASVDVQPLDDKSTATSPQLMQRKRKSETDLDEMEKKLKIREKALKLKEETFERIVATFQVKMEEMEEKMMKLDKRVEKIEEKKDTGYIDSRMEQMEERLKKVEEKIEEDDFVAV